MKPDIMRTIAAAIFATGLIYPAWGMAQNIRGGLDTFPTGEPKEEKVGKAVAPDPEVTGKNPQTVKDQTFGSIYMPNSTKDLLSLIRECETPACMSYVYGVISGASVISAIADRPSPFCAPDYVTGNDIRDAIIKTVEKTPQLNDLPAAFAILSTFAQNWPCLSTDDLKNIQDESMKMVDPDMLDKLLDQGGVGYSAGDPNEQNKRLIVFHDQNCPYCRRFTAEAERLVENGWYVAFYPVAVATEESGGYGAVEIAMAKNNPEIAKALHYADNASSVYDIEMALRIAQREGINTTAILEAVSKSGAAERLKINTETFFGFGAEGTPAIVLGYNLYSGFIGYQAIQDLFDTFDVNE